MPRRSSSACSSDSRRLASISEIGLPRDVVAGGLAVDQLLRRSRWPVLRRLGFHPGGDERSSMRGAGLEYSDVREYQAGDDPRTIEWNITARSDRPYVRESLPDRGLDAWLLVDITRSLDWGTARCLKRQLALEFAAVVGQLLIGRGNRVGALLFDDRVRSIIPPSAGRTALLQLIARMERATDGQTPSAVEGGQGAGPTDLGRALGEAGRLIRRPSMMVLISDFMTPGGWQQRRSRAYAVRFTNLALLNQVMGKGPGFRRHLPAILFVAGVAGLLFSMARPQASIRVPKGQTSVMLAVDVSGSMAASDVQPTRIEAAIAAGRTLIDKLPSNAQVGLVIFNSQAEVVTPLTTDKGSVKDALGTVRPGGGTAIGSAIQVAVAQLASITDPNGAKSQNYAMVILLTDGTSNTGIDPATAAGEAAKAKIPV